MRRASVGRKVVILARRVCVGVVVKVKCGEVEVGVAYCGDTINRDGVRLGCGVCGETKVSILGDIERILVLEFMTGVMGGIDGLVGETESLACVGEGCCECCCEEGEKDCCHCLRS